MAMKVISRRGVLAAVASAALAPRARGGVRDIEHVKIHGDRKSYCGHPRQCGLFYFGRGEVAVMHNHAPCAYQKLEDVAHDYGGYHSRSVVLLQRSLDSGRTFPEAHNVVVWNEAAPLEERLKIIV